MLLNIFSQDGLDISFLNGPHFEYQDEDIWVEFYTQEEYKQTGGVKFVIKDKVSDTRVEFRNFKRAAQYFFKQIGDV